MARLDVSARELRGQLAVLAMVLWVAALVNAWTPSLYLRSGQVKGTDFVHFYTLARLAADGRYQDLLSSTAIREAQLLAVPESRDDYLPAFYGPQVGVMLAPLGRMSYVAALVTWSVLTAGVFLLSTMLVARRLPTLRPHVGVVILGSLAFPPFWLLIQHGHPTAIAVGAMVLAWAALARGAPSLSGLCLGLMAYKPPLVIPIAAVLLLSGSWRMLLGLAAGAVLQFVPAWLALGPGAVVDYVRLLVDLVPRASQMVAQPAHFYGWRGFWFLLVPHPLASIVLYGVCAIVTVAFTAIAWRRSADPSVRMGLLGLSVGLASPHLYGYDLAVLGPTWLWLSAWYVARGRMPRLFGRALYAGYLAPLLGPLVVMTRVQFLTPILAVLMLVLLRQERGAGQRTD